MLFRSHWFNQLMLTRLSPMIKDQYLNGKGRVVVHDAFIVKYQHDSNPINIFTSSQYPSTASPKSTSISTPTSTSLSTSIFSCLPDPTLPVSSQRHLPLHTDESTHSLTIALNPLGDYEGGGTYFASLNAAIRPGKRFVFSSFLQSY